MKKIPLISATLLLAAMAAAEATAQVGGPTRGGPPAAPAPGSPATFRAGAELQAALQRSIAAGTEPGDAAIVLTDQYRGNLVRRSRPNEPLAHAGSTELHYILEGSATILTGGSIVRREGVPATIEGGQAQPVVPGDIIIIPPGSPHMYSRIDEPVTFLEFRFVAPE
jgi:mannose-6-phosphate isomerase-like protein (cupin superfamily)